MMGVSDGQVGGVDAGVDGAVGDEVAGQAVVASGRAADVLLAHHRAQQLLVRHTVVDLGQLSLDVPPPIRAPGPLPNLRDDVREPRPAHSAR